MTTPFYFVLRKILPIPNHVFSTDGVFLVRESTNFPGDYTLCVCFQGKVEHYRVIARNNSLTIDEEEFFENLTQLVEHYKKDADGLCTQLTAARKKSDNVILSHDVDFKAFRDAGWVMFIRNIFYDLGQSEKVEISRQKIITHTHIWYRGDWLYIVRWSWVGGGGSCISFRYAFLTIKNALLLNFWIGPWSIFDFLVLFIRV